MENQLEISFDKPKFTKQDLLSGRNFWVGNYHLVFFVKKEAPKRAKRKKKIEKIENWQPAIDNEQEEVIEKKQPEVILGYLRSRFDAHNLKVIEITEKYFRLRGEYIYFRECELWKTEIMPEYDIIGRFRLINFARKQDYQ